MSQMGTSAWWTDVQHLRDAAERTDEARRRADQADLAQRRERRERRQVEAEVAPARRLEADAQAPRRRTHADAAAPRRADVAPVPRRGGYGDPVALPGRRTVEIRGRTVPAPAVPRSLELDRTRRPQRRAVERVGPRPDRLAMWALLMG
ncbi:MAG: hypothetical protein QOD69_2016, partial [Solirubrobacteraceae bacterium]|nr:hypothetical protein [Solirubrobacteraceae bacterium]